jgi:hypothetical protein
MGRAPLATCGHSLCVNAKVCECKGSTIGSHVHVSTSHHDIVFDLLKGSITWSSARALEWGYDVARSIDCIFDPVNCRVFIDPPTLPQCSGTVNEEGAKLEHWTWTTLCGGSNVAYSSNACNAMHACTYAHRAHARESLHGNGQWAMGNGGWWIYSGG